MKLKHYYHIYADGEWEEPLSEHLEALNDSGLFDALDFFGVGIVGAEDQREKVKLSLPPKVVISIEAEKGWEQTTQSAIDPEEGSYIFYAHTKGASEPNHGKRKWRHVMEYVNVCNWERCVEALESGADAAGCYWVGSPQFFYAGTYWWATAEHVSRLAPLAYTTRWDAESWIGSAPGRMADLWPGHPGLVMTDRQASYIVPKCGETPMPVMVSFRVPAKIGGYKRNRVYTEQLTPYLQALINKKHVEVLGSLPVGTRTMIFDSIGRTNYPYEN